MILKIQYCFALSTEKIVAQRRYRQAVWRKENDT